MYVAGRPVKIIHTDNEHENTVNLQARNVSNLLLIMWKNFFKAFETHNDNSFKMSILFLSLFLVILTINYRY